MAKILRESALKIINKTYEVINEELKKNRENTISGSNIYQTEWKE